MKIDKLPSGSYRIRKTINGKVYSITFDHKPSELEIYQALLPKAQENAKGCEMLFEQAAMEYIDIKRNVLSPSTVREYTRTLNRISDDFNKKKIKDITQIDVQREINIMALKSGAKTVRNYHGFMSAVLSTYKPEMKLNTTLPKKRKSEPYIPTDAEVKQLIEYSKTHCDGRYYVPIVLACYGLSRSEICALTINDIKDNIVSINKGKVENENKEWVIKDIPKTTARIRKVPISQELAEYIRNQGFVFDGYPNSITCFIADACKDLNIEHFSIHKLRHYFCSKLSSENVDVETILALGGWETDYVMKNVYRHKMDDKVKQASDMLTKTLFD